MFLSSPPPNEFYTLSLHDALPILAVDHGDRRLVIHRVRPVRDAGRPLLRLGQDRKSTRLNSSHTVSSYAVFCLKKKRKRLTPNAIGLPSTERTTRVRLIHLIMVGC